MQNNIYHSGTKGMRWGRHISPNTKSLLDSSALVTSNANKINDSIMTSHSNVKIAKAASKMSAEELTSKINRMSLEQKYVALNAANVSKGQARVKHILETSGAVLLTASAITGLALNIKQLKA